MTDPRDAHIAELTAELAEAARSCGDILKVCAAVIQERDALQSKLSAIEAELDEANSTLEMTAGALLRASEKVVGLQSALTSTRNARDRAREEEREACAQIAHLFVEEFTDRRDDQLRDTQPTAALVHGRQAQTADDIEKAIRARAILAEQGDET